MKEKQAGRILGLDYGTKRIGIAISDELRIIAQPLEYISADPIFKVWERLKELLHEMPYRLIIIGLPRNMNGSNGAAVEKVKHFIHLLKKEKGLDIPIKTWDERLTTVLANRLLSRSIHSQKRRKRRKEKVDKVAAAIILQGFLDAHQDEDHFIQL